MRIDDTLSVVQRTLFLLEVDQFKQVASDEIAAMAARMTEMRFAAGETVFQDGDVEGRLYFVVDGELEHVRNGAVVRRTARGFSTGLFVLLGLPADETVRAATDSHLVSLAREDFIDALSDSPAFAVGVIRGLAMTLLSNLKRIEELEARISGGRR
jgi:CRP-like cAMP-binding protein